MRKNDKMNNCPALRRAVARKIPLIMKLMAEFHANDRLPWRPKQAQQTIRELIRTRTHGACWLIEMNQEVIGFLVLTLGFSIEFRGRYAFIDEFYILPDFRGKGIGSAVLYLVEGYCAQSKIHTVHLEVERSSPRAHRLYARAGFEDRGFYLMSRWVGLRTNPRHSIESYK